MKQYLEYARMDAYGAFRDKLVGPFGAGMNVVYGANEAGKSTLASFIGSVLFGWEDARTGRNTYKPRDGERAGSLVFASQTSNTEEQTHSQTLSRARNTEGLQGATHLVDTIDKHTYNTLFSLTADELRSLQNTSDITARLLTAGSGTQSNPAGAMAAIEQQLSECMSKAASAQHSVVKLTEQLEEKKAEARAAASEAEQHKREDREYRELARSRQVAFERINRLNDQIERLSGARSRMEQLDQQITQRTEDLSELRMEEAQAAALADGQAYSLDPKLLAMDASEEHIVRGALDNFAEEQAKSERAVEMAAENSAASTAAYESLLEVAEEHTGRHLQVAISIILPALFIAAGIALFIQGRSAGSFSLSLFGGGMVVLAFVLAIAAIVVLFRTDPQTNEREKKKHDARWVMLQDSKKLASLTDAQQAIDDRIHTYLEENGLGRAQGSLRQAKLLLDEAHAARAKMELEHQRSVALDLRLTSAEEALADLELEKTRLQQELATEQGILKTFDVASLAAALENLAVEREAAQELYEHMNLRYGELGTVLSSAKEMHNLDELRIEEEQLRTQLAEAKERMALLLIAKRLLDTAIASWESRSQPHVYKEAGRLLSIITEGHWVDIALADDGKLTVTNADKVAVEPRQLSLGTCQQLYLALRIALLLSAPRVGAALPVLADDILVNFDATRQAGAVRALGELAKQRQVILLTCHREVFDAVRAEIPHCTTIEL